MKKILPIMFLLILFATGKLDAQTFVSTEKANKTVVLEEFTGVTCQYCPDGHKRANQLKESNPEKVILINIHQGGFAQTTPDYRTEFGDALANQVGVNSYPMGTINRHVFSGSSAVLDRGRWATAANEILNASAPVEIEGNTMHREELKWTQSVSPVNVAAKATIDFATRQIVIDVEMYYTATSPIPHNLNVAILQNNILGNQTGASQYNPTQMVGSLYRHMHMLRHLVTGQWGEVITSTTQGSFISKQYTYTAPEHIRNVEMLLEDLEIVVFLAETRKDIVTGATAELQYLNKNPYISKFESVMSNCSEAYFNATVKNISEEDIISMEFTYDLNGEENTINWNARRIAPGSSDTIRFPIFDPFDEEYTATITFDSYNDGLIPISVPITATNSTVAKSRGEITLKLVTDAYASETTFKIFKEDGSVLLSGGPFTNLSGVGTTERLFNITPPAEGCYKLEVYDSYSDGINTGYGNGYFQLEDQEGTVVIYNDGKFGAKATHHFYAYLDAKMEQFASSSFKIYPNPTSNSLKIITTENIEKIEIFNLQGQKVMAFGNEVAIDVANLANGIYLLQVTTETGMKTEKFVKQ